MQSAAARRCGIFFAVLSPQDWAGAFEVVHAFWTRGWGGFIWQVLLGILYIAFGVVLVTSRSPVP